MTTLSAPASVPTTSRVRRVSFRILTALPALLVLTFGGQLLVSGWFSSADGGIHRFHELSWGVAEGIIIFVALIVSLRRPERRPAAYQQVAAGCLALVVTMAMTGAFDVATLLVVIILAVAAGLHPARRELLHRRWHPPTLILTVVLAIPLGWYASAQAALHRSGSAGDPHIELAHYVGTTLAAVAIVLTLIVAAARTRGYRLAGYSAAAALAVLGVASIAFPEAESAFTSAWAVLAVAGAAATIAAIRFPVKGSPHPRPAVSAAPAGTPQAGPPAPSGG